MIAMRRIAAITSLLLLCAGAAPAQIAAGDYARVNAALLDGHVLPRYERLGEASAAFAEGVREHCAGRPGNTGVLRTQFHALMDAWMGVEHLRFGPVEQFMRGHRLYFWPQARGRVGDAVDALLDGAISVDRLRNASVAAQGLPAVEHLLFRPGASAHDAARCALLGAISENMHEMAGAIVAEWRGTFARRFVTPGPDNAYFRTHQDASLALFKALHGGLQLIASVKIAPVIGERPAAVRPHLAESAASGRSLRNIVVNLEALQALYAGEGGAGLGELVRASGTDPGLDALLRKAFAMTLDGARAFDGPLAAAAGDSATRPAVQTLATRVSALEQIVRTRVAQALGLQVGFNALDGD